MSRRWLPSFILWPLKAIWKWMEDFFLHILIINLRCRVTMIVNRYTVIVRCYLLSSVIFVLLFPLLSLLICLWSASLPPGDIWGFKSSTSFGGYRDMLFFAQRSSDKKKYSSCEAGRSMMDIHTENEVGPISYHGAAYCTVGRTHGRAQGARQVDCRE